MNCKRPLGHRGISLIETAVALALLGISMGSISTLIIQHMRQVGTSNAYSTAISLGQQELEDVRSLQYTSIASRTSTSTVGQITYTIATTVAADSPAANMKTITTNVTWTKPYGTATQTYTLNTIFTALQD